MQNSNEDELRAQFLLNPQVTFLNHGSFGACPREVFAEYQRWQLELERQPVEFLGRCAPALLAEARQPLAEYLHVRANDLVYFLNPTTAVNMLARSLDLGPGDEILATDQEYGAMDRTWRFICQRRGAQYVQRDLPLPMRARDEFVELLFEGVTPRTRAIFISHITSPTALIFPIAEICARARQAGILTIVDGAHAVGQIPLDLEAIGADLYAGACHKWLCAPKGAAFLFARPEVQPWLEPLVVSWGYQSEKPGPSQFIDYHEWQGTRDLAAFLSVPAAIRFQESRHWDQVRADCHALARQARARLGALTGLEDLCPDSPEWFAQMFSVRLPQDLDLEALKLRLYQEFKIEVPLIKWKDQPLMRISIQGYNTQEDVDALVDALAFLLQGDRVDR